MDNMEEPFRKERSAANHYGRQSIATGGEKTVEEQAIGWFRTLDEKREGSIPLQRLLEVLQEHGLSKSDPWLKELLPQPFQEKRGETERLPLEGFIELLQDEKADLVRRAFRKELAIPHFAEFRKEIENIYEQTRGIQEGTADETVPQPAS